MVFLGFRVSLGLGFRVFLGFRFRVTPAQVREEVVAHLRRYQEGYLPF